MRTTFFLLLLIGLLGTTMVPNAKATDQTKTFVLAVPPQGWPPYTMPEGHPRRGMAADIAHKILQKLGYQLVIRYLPNSRSLKLMAHGLVDGRFKAMEWINDPLRFYWSDPLLAVQDVLVYPKGKDKPFVSPDLLQGHPIGTVEGYGYPVFGPYFETRALERSDAKNEHSLLHMLHRGRTHAAIINRYVLDWVLANDTDLDTIDFSVASNPISTVQYRLMFSPKPQNKALIAQFNSEFARIKNNGELSKIIKAYLQK